MTKHAYKETGKVNMTAPSVELNTVDAIEKEFYFLFGAIARYEEILDSMAGIGQDTARAEEKSETTVVNTWKSTPNKLRLAGEHIHQLNDRLRDMFS